MLKPIDIQEKEFEIKVRGYDRDEVDDFLDEIIDTFDILYRTNKSLQQKVDELEAQIRAGAGAKEAVELARYQCDEMRRQAKADADAIIKNARETAAAAASDAEYEKQKQKLSEAKIKLADFKKSIRENCGDIMAIIDKMD